MARSDGGSTRRIPGFCALCTSRCGAFAVVDDGRLVGLEADPSHPTGRALCIKGRVAPELVYHPDRLRSPLKRTRPKGDRDAGWEPISWEEALDTSASHPAGPVAYAPLKACSPRGSRCPGPSMS